MLDRSEPLDNIGIRPCLAELFRTCVYPPSLPLRVEKILVESCNRKRPNDSSESEVSSGDERKTVHRLFLSDGVLVVQALLEKRLLPLVDFAATFPGDTIILKKLKLKRARRLNGQGEIVFLGIMDCDIIRSEVSAQPGESKKRSASEHLETDHEDEVMSTKKAKLTASPIQSSRKLAEARKMSSQHVKSTQDSDSDDFETSTFDRSQLEKKRKALQGMDSNQSFESQKSLTMERATTMELEKQQRRARLASPHPTVAAAQSTVHPDLIPRSAHPENPSHTNQQLPLPTPTTLYPSQPTPPQHQQHTQPTQPAPYQRPSQQPQREPPYHTLLSLLEPDLHSPHPLPTKSYPCTLFAIISWISPTILHPRPRSPFPPKRHIKIHDRSITSRHSGVTVAVFCDARNFRPEIGTMALFRGLVMQRTGGGDVILNAYERLMREPGVDGKVGRWMEDDGEILEGLGWDVGGLKGWWEERQRERGRSSGGKGRL